jgi:hypothetical protein
MRQLGHTLEKKTEQPAQCLANAHCAWAEWLFNTAFDHADEAC